jgi:surfeit locus 1 family protein
MTFRPLPLLTVLSLVSLGILIWLGNWQYGRYLGKQNMDPAELPPVQSITADVIDLPGKSVQNIYGIADGEPIWRRYVLVTRVSDGATLLMAADATGGANPVDMTVPSGARLQAHDAGGKRRGIGGDRRTAFGHC